jgi:hypothetical protein
MYWASLISPSLIVFIIGHTDILTTENDAVLLTKSSILLAVTITA